MFSGGFSVPLIVIQTISSAAFYFGFWLKKITPTIKFLKGNFILKKWKRKG